MNILKNRNKLVKGELNSFVLLDLTKLFLLILIFSFLISKLFFYPNLIQFSFLKSSSRNINILSAILLMPIIEEIGFRWYLDAKRVNLYISLFANLILVSISVMGLIHFFVIMLFYLKLKKNKFSYRRLIKPYIYISASLFMAFHLTLHDFPSILSSLPFALLYYIIGLLLSLLRLKNGIMTSMVFYILYSIINYIIIFRL